MTMSLGMGLYCAFGWACSRKLLRTMREAKVKVLISYYTDRV
eukprot:COSAG05_NODE_180_length_14817_cov_423.925262_17_plen_42_part_00